MGTALSPPNQTNSGRLDFGVISDLVYLWLVRDAEEPDSGWYLDQVGTTHHFDARFAEKIDQRAVLEQVEEAVEKKIDGVPADCNTLLVNGVLCSQPNDTGAFTLIVHSLIPLWV